MIISTHRWPLGNSGAISVSEAERYIDQFKTTIEGVPVCKLIRDTSYSVLQGWLALNDSLRLKTTGPSSIRERANALAMESNKVVGGKEVVTDIIAQRIVRTAYSASLNPLILKGNFPSIFSGVGLLAVPTTTLTDVFIEVVVNYQTQTVELFYNDTQVYSVGFTGDSLIAYFGTLAEETDAAGTAIVPWHVSSGAEMTTYYSQSYRAVNFTGDTDVTPRLGYIDIAYRGLASSPKFGTDTTLESISGGTIPTSLSDPLSLVSNSLVNPSNGAYTSKEYGYISPADSTYTGFEILSIGCTALASRRDATVASALDVVIRKEGGTKVGAHGNFQLSSQVSRIPYVICDLITLKESFVGGQDYQDISGKFDIGFKSGETI